MPNVKEQTFHLGSEAFHSLRHVRLNERSDGRMGVMDRYEVFHKAHLQPILRCEGNFRQFLRCLLEQSGRQEKYLSLS